MPTARLYSFLDIIPKKITLMSILTRFFRPADSVKSEDLRPEDFLERRAEDAPVIDVRTPQEYAGGHLSGAANLDVFEPDFVEQFEALGINKDEPVYLYCRSGNRSGKAARLLRERGYSEAYNVGGYDSLKRAGAPVEQ